jgi:hypothetical protein
LNCFWKYKDEIQLRNPEPEWTELGAAVRVVFYPHRETIENETFDVPINVPANKRQNGFLNRSAKISEYRVLILQHTGVYHKKPLKETSLI